MKHLKILHLATYDEFGGAARAGKRIYNSIKTQPLDCEMYVLHKTSNDDTIKQQEIDLQKKLRLIHNLLVSYRSQKNTASGILKSYGEASAGIIDQINTASVDVIHLHWICNFLSIEDISQIKKPIVWTLHDMWPFSGCEHVSLDENAFFYSNSTPDWDSIDEESYKVWRKKRELWKDREFHIVAQSRWLADRAKRSLLFANCIISIIPAPINTNFWKPKPTLDPIKEFGFDVNQNTLLFVANDPFHNPIKGWNLLIETLNNLQNSGFDDFQLVIVGDDGASIQDTKLPFKTHCLNTIDSDLMLMKLYSSAHLLVIPSKSEAFSLVSIEAQACGLPIIGFEIGGIPDIVIDQSNGLVIPCYDTHAFAAGIRWILEDKDRRNKMSVNSRKNAVERFSTEIVGKNYLELYNTVIEKSK